MAPAAGRTDERNTPGLCSVGTGVGSVSVTSSAPTLCGKHAAVAAPQSRQGKCGQRTRTAEILAIDMTQLQLNAAQMRPSWSCRSELF